MKTVSGVGFSFKFYKSYRFRIKLFLFRIIGDVSNPEHILRWKEPGRGKENQFLLAGEFYRGKKIIRPGVFPKWLEGK